MYKTQEGQGTGTQMAGQVRVQMPEHEILPVKVRCSMFVQSCLARNARCNAMSHLTAVAVAVSRTCLARNGRCNTMSHLTAAGR